jgi:Methylase involved in ubiquinone/menaquinone biosynthesis
MRLRHLYYILISTVFVFSACAPNSIRKERSTQKTFQPILQFMDYQPGMTFADVGAGSGALTVAMASLMDLSTVYVQDIDTSILRKDKLDKMIEAYRKESGKDLRRTNKFIVTIGDIQKTNLPNNTFDLIYSNATVHSFISLDSMVVDIGRKLKPNGVVFFRDSFKGDHGSGDFCPDPKCKRPLISVDEFLATMKRNGFQLKKQSPDMSGYPVFGFYLN